MSDIKPFSLKDAPALIERHFPSQKVSIEAYKEQMAVHGKSLTKLGSYWKGRKPLHLNRSVLMACLLPVTNDVEKDLRVFDLIMGFADESFEKRLPKKHPLRSAIGSTSYLDLVNASERSENVPNLIDAAAWQEINAHLGTSASTLPELVEQLGIMRFGRRPKFADVFSGSGQIPFEAARIGFDTYASDLNPIACMLTWGAFNVVGGDPKERPALEAATKEVCDAVQAELDALGVELDGYGWRAKAYLYCVEVRCPESGWMVPLMPSRAISVKRRILAELKPDPMKKRYEVVVREGTPEEMKAAERGTIQKEGRGKESFIVHSPDGVNVIRVPYARVRDGQPTTPGGKPPGLRMWERTDVAPRPNDTLQERLYAILWQRPRGTGQRLDLEYRSVTPADLQHEATVLQYVTNHLPEWQDKGYVPSMRIESGKETDRLLRERGWTHWHHLFNPRQLLTLSLLFKHASASDQYARLAFGLGRALDYGSRLSLWHVHADAPDHVFTNQALNTFFNYGTRTSISLRSLIDVEYRWFPIASSTDVNNHPAREITSSTDLLVSDPPFADSVMYEEIYEYFISWFQKNPPAEFKHFVWDARRSLAIKGSGDPFKERMVDTYKSITACMPDNGIQVMMFTHRDPRVWAEMTAIVWGAGLQVTGAWYVTTEVDSALRDGAYVKGTIILVLRKAKGDLSVFSDELLTEIEETVNIKIAELTGMNTRVTEGRARAENKYRDADLEMAGYAAALEVLTRYRFVDGRDMHEDALLPEGSAGLQVVNDLVNQAVRLAKEALIPQGVTPRVWRRLTTTERYLLKLIVEERSGALSLATAQVLAKAFGMRGDDAFLGEANANAVRVASVTDLAREAIIANGLLLGTVTGSVLIALAGLMDGLKRHEVMRHLAAHPAFTDRRLFMDVARFLSLNLREQAERDAASQLVMMIDALAV